MQSSKVGRFDQSFVFHMIRDFFLLLIVVTGIELGLRYAIVVYEFENHDREMVDLQAKNLAADVKSIMLNAGGPVAARTVYPILKKNFEAMGLSVAIVPAPVTVSSMKFMFNMEPQGIPAAWPSGKHNEATAVLTAEKYCVSCHVHAKVGDVLGTVTVRSYLPAKLSAWWAEVRLTSVLWVINIVTHTIVLFLLLQMRMEPLLSLRSTVSNLAKGIIDLSHRARVNSHDEFGELALDLNHFLDRITHVVEDLDKILTRVITVSHRLNQVSSQMNGQFEKIHDSVQSALSCAFGEPGFQSGPFTALAATLETLSRDPAVPEETRARLRDVFGRLQDALGKAENLPEESPQSSEMLNALSKEVHGFGHFLGEMALLEEKMQVVAESGQDLLSRLTHAKEKRAQAVN